MSYRAVIHPDLGVGEREDGDKEGGFVEGNVVQLTLFRALWFPEKFKPSSNLMISPIRGGSRSLCFAPEDVPDLLFQLR